MKHFWSQHQILDNCFFIDMSNKSLYVCVLDTNAFYFKKKVQIDCPSKKKTVHQDLKQKQNKTQIKYLVVNHKANTLYILLFLSLEKIILKINKTLEVK